MTTTVYVRFGAEQVLSVAEQFASAQDADAFAARYESYEDAQAWISPLPVEIRLVRSSECSATMDDCSTVVDPYWEATDEEWHRLVAGDGHNYGGVIETVRGEPGESRSDTIVRARARAEEIRSACRCPACLPAEVL